MNTPTPPAAEPTRRRYRPALYGLAAVLIVGIAVVGLRGYAQRVWQGFQEYQEAQRSVNETAPIGYIGVHLRKSYNDKPARFLFEQDGRKLLWAANGEDGKPIFHDVTDATIGVEALSGGFGNDSIPGIDYPIFERPDSPQGQRLRDRQPVYGLVLDDSPRAYPAELLRKIEVVNDRDGSTPFVIVFDRSREAAEFYDARVDGRAVTFGTTGYAYGTTPDPNLGKPLLYDRSSKSLWLPEADALVCVSGASRGAKLPRIKTPEKMSWSAWRAEHPRSLSLIGSDRQKPIPVE
jgi:hypothetical protein